MNQSQYFEFEDKDSDFPYYKNDKFLSGKTGIILLFSVLLFIILILGPVKFHGYQEGLILFLAMSIPFVIASGGKIGTLFKKPTLNNLKLVVWCVLGNLLFLFVLVVINTIINTVVPVNMVNSAQNFGDYSSIGLLNCIIDGFQIIAEELVRINVFLIVLYLIYKFTNNRKNSVIIAAIVSLLVFGLLHVNTYTNIIYCILVMGFGSFFTLYPYLKTRNALLSVLVHMIYNLLVLIVHLLL
jgi:membrane protease YdiL (CAAX protease family)